MALILMILFSSYLLVLFFILSKYSFVVVGVRKERKYFVPSIRVIQIKHFVEYVKSITFSPSVVRKCPKFVFANDKPLVFILIGGSDWHRLTSLISDKEIFCPYRPFISMSFSETNKFKSL